MTDLELFDLVRIAARQREAAAELLAIGTPPLDPASPEAVSRAWVNATHEMDPEFDGTYCGRRKTAAVVDRVPNAGDPS